MYKNYFGKERQGILDWLICDWLPKGPTTCFVVGFPGVGKSDVAAAVTEHAERQLKLSSIYIEVPNQENPSFGDLMLDLADQLAAIGHAAMRTALSQPGSNPAYAFERALRDDILVVIDEFGRFFDRGGKLCLDVAGVLSHLRNRPALRGRLLLLSDVAIESERWSEAFPTKELRALDSSEAIALLNDRLREKGKVDDVPETRKGDLVWVLGFNPRAIETLAAALAFESLDEIVGRDPGLWEVTDREFSADFLEILERRLLEGTLTHLDPLTLKRLTMLAVHRVSFEASAFEALTSGTRKEWRDLRHSLVSRFLVQLRNQWHSMNPVVREISLARLRENASEFKTAHSIAADHHLRHFRARNLVLDNSSLTASFAELRYHLFHAGRTSELREVVLRLASHFKESWKSTSQVPQDRSELDERIGILAALLQDEGPKSLEYYLARCLQTRGSASDLREALIHATRATSGRAPAAVWFFRASLHRDLGDRGAAVQTVLDAVRIVNPGDAIGTLYGLGGQILAEQGRIDDAQILMREGILKVPPSKNLFTLYQSAAELLGQAGKTEDAVALLKEGMKVIPADKNLFSLYQSAAELIANAGDIKAAEDYLRAGIRSATRSGGLIFHLYQRGAEFLNRRGAKQAAIDLLLECIREVPGVRNSLSVFKATAEFLAEQERYDEALAVLDKGRIAIASGLRQMDVFYRAKIRILICAGRLNEARVCVDEGFSELRPDETAFLKRLADEIAEIELQEGQGERTSSTQPLAPLADTQVATGSEHGYAVPGHGRVIHISYAWGGESEDVADRLERKLVARGHGVRRDKSSMRTGDWISRFIAEIGLATKVVVILSAKYLRSPYCMQELLYLWQSSLGDRGSMLDRIAPVVLSDACIDQAVDRLKVVRYWKEERQRLEGATEGLDLLSWGDSTRAQLLLIRGIEHHSADMLSWVADVLIPRGRSIVEERFDDFIELIEKTSD